MSISKVALIPLDTAKLTRGIVTDFSEAYAYKNGVRSDAPIGIKANAAFPAMQFEKADVTLPLGVKVDSFSLPVEVIFEGLTAKLYSFDGKTGIKMTATGIRPATAPVAGK